MHISTDAEQINAIVKVLKDYKGLLNDGYKYYRERASKSVNGVVNKTLEEVAVDIIESLNKVIWRE